MVYVMLVGAYPFERPEDKHDNQKLQKMIQVHSCSTAPLWKAPPLMVTFAIFSCCIRVCLCPIPWACPAWAAMTLPVLNGICCKLSLTCWLLFAEDTEGGV